MFIDHDAVEVDVLVLIIL